MRKPVDRRTFLTTAASGAAALALCAVLAIAAEQSQRRPNVVCIACDALGCGDLGCYGAPDARTPNLDALARDGVRLTAFYAAAPAGAQTRCALLTGQYPARAGSAEAAGPELPPDARTIAKTLRDSGYDTELADRVHLGSEGESSLDGLRVIEAVTKRSVDFVESHRDETFFLTVLYDTGDGDPAARDKAVEAVDAGVGRILAALRRHGLDRTTFVVFGSDAGVALPPSDASPSSANADLRQAALRVPALLCWSGKIPSGKAAGQPAITMDLAATILAAAETTPPAGARLDGENLLPILCGEAPERERTFFWQLEGRKAALRGRWKYLRQADAIDSLYDLVSDAAETTNLASEYPERLEEMRALLVQWERDVAPPRSRRARRWEDTYG